ncbi:MAG: radical SAM protein [Gemmatimonadales bacterium]|nr:MAG: radical SAM protein [Gemmatimonadales bacterium]
MKVLLVQGFLEKGYPFPAVPLGLCYLREALKADGHAVTIYDPNVSTAPDVDTELTDLLRAGDYDVVGLSLRNVDNNEMFQPRSYYLWLPRTARRVKQVAPRARIIAGGSGFSIFPEIIMRRVPELDFGVHLDGTESLPELLRNPAQPERIPGVLYRRDGKVVFTGRRPPPDLDRLPAHPWGDLDFAPYSRHFFAAGVLSKTGCVFNCAYCTYPMLSGRHFAARSPVKIVDDIQFLAEQRGVKSLFIVDSIFNYPQEHCVAVCREIVRRGLKVEWTAYFIEKYMNDEVADAALEAGCIGFGFSPDGIHAASMEGMCKASDPEDLRRVVEIIRRRPRAKASFSFFLNPPGQDFRGILRLFKFIVTTRLMNRRQFVSLGLWYPRVYPNTPLHERVVRENGFPAGEDAYLPDDDASLTKLFWINPRNAWLNTLFFGIIRPLQMLRRLVVKTLQKRGHRIGSQPG